MHYFEFAAMNGNVKARYSLGLFEGQAGNYQRAYKHLLISAKVGHERSLELVTKGFRSGHITKDEYANTLRAYQKSVDEMKSGARGKAEDIMAQHRAAQRGDT